MIKQIWEKDIGSAGGDIEVLLTPPVVAEKKVFTIEEAMKNLKKFFELKNDEWIPLENIMKNKETDNFIKKSYIASHFSASLELAKKGVINIRQHALFAPIYIKKKQLKNGKR